MKTRLSPAAADDLTNILRALSAESPSAARGFRNEFRKRRRFIGDFPHASRQTDEATLRCVNMGRYPYLIFFEMVGNYVVVMRVLHGARDPRLMPAMARQVR